MSFILSAFILGLAGSLHCVGMCGPLVMAIPTGANRSAWLINQLLHNIGRIFTYLLLGIVVGTIGNSLITVGFQQWLSLIAGVFMLVFIAFPVGFHRLQKSPFRWVGWIKTSFSGLLQKRSMSSRVAMGMLNGLLPCGLVYVALAAALALGSPIKSALFMMVFGISTSPALVAVGRAGHWIKSRLRVRSMRRIQLGLAVVALLIIIRGANLGIPYMSPKVQVEQQQVDCCHRGGVH